MMTTRIFKLYFICFAVAAVSLTACSKKKKPNLQGTVVPVGTGFGYKISINGKLYINQTNIPAVPGNTPFCDSIDARKTCNKVLEKMETGKLPFVTIQELKALKIKTKC